MDTSVLEYTAEDLIAHRLQRAGLLVAKPRFDQQGADLLAMLQVDDGARFCRVQCKGRTLRAGARSEVVIPEAYVTKGFILFLYVETGDLAATYLYCLFEADLRANTRNRADQLVLSLDARTFENKLSQFNATPSRLEQVRTVVTEANATEEFSALRLTIGTAVERDEALPLRVLGGARGTGHPESQEDH